MLEGSMAMGVEPGDDRGSRNLEALLEATLSL